MAKDKAPNSSEKDVLTQKVDAMMDPAQPDAVVVKPETVPDDKPEIDIFKEVGTAPELSPKLKKTIDKIGQPETDGGDTAIANPEASDTVNVENQTSNINEVPDLEAGTLMTSELSDPDTDKAVDDIVVKESDQVLEAEDSKIKTPDSTAKQPSALKAKLQKLLKNKWTWIGLGVVLVAVLAVPFTRYQVLGLVLKSKADITVVDSKTGTPVSNAELNLGGSVAKTDGNGQAKFNAPLGRHTLRITKQYYTTYSQPFFVGFSADGTGKVYVVATGRQIPITVLNALDGKPLAGAEIKIGSSSAKTDKLGKALVVVPINKNTSDPGSITLSGYAETDVTVVVTDKTVPANTFKLAPSGHVYFLSNKSGKIDVIKTNLDGSGRKVVLAGTGNEDLSTTSLLAAKDWKYLVLESTRDNSNASPALYLIDTSDDSVTKFESTDKVGYQIIGWHGHDFLYSITKGDNTKAGNQQVKSYDADHRQTNLVVQDDIDSASGSYQYLSNFYVVGDELIYSSSWQYASYSYYSHPADSSPHSDTVTGVSLSTGKKTLDYGEIPAHSGYFQITQYEAKGLYVQQSSGNDTGYFKIEDGKSTPVSDLTSAKFNQPYPTFLQSPSGKQTFWTVYQDGKNTLTIGDEEGQNSKQIASLSDYSPYGWFTDKYLLVTKNNSELYIMPAGTLSDKQQPLKISDYYKQQQTFRGYGGGY